MFNNPFLKKDPLLEAVRGAMQDGETRRQAEAIVNEHFGVYSRKAVVREHLAAYDAALEEVYNELKEGVKADPNDPSYQGGGDVTVSAPKHVKPSDPERIKNFKDPRDPSVQTGGDVTSGGKPASIREGLADTIRSMNPFAKVGDALSTGPAKAAPDTRIMGNPDTAKKPTPSTAPKDGSSGSPFPANEEAQLDELKKPTPETALKVVNRATDRDEWSAKAANRLYSRYKKAYEPKEKKTEVKEELAKKDYDKDGKIETPKDEVWGSRLRAAKMAGKLKEEEQIDELYGKGQIHKLRKGIRDEGQALSQEYGEGKYHNKRKRTPADHGKHGAYLKKARKVWDKSKRADALADAIAAKNLAKKKQDAAFAKNPRLKEETQIDEAVSRKHFQQVADLIKSNPDQNKRNELATHHAGIFAKQNPRFSHEKFHAAAGSTAHQSPKKMDEAAYSAKAARAGKDIGKPGKSFSKIAKSAGERYGSAERGKKVAGAILKRIRAKHMKEEQSFNAALLEAGKAAPLPPRRPSSGVMAKLSYAQAGTQTPAPTTGKAPGVATPTTSATPVTGTAAPAAAKPSGYSDIVSGAVNPSAAKSAMDAATARSAAVRGAGPNPATAAATATAPSKAAPTPVSTVQTKGGAFPVFSKGSEAASEFKKAYSAAAPGSTFKWKASGETGPEREYKAAPVAKAAGADAKPTGVVSPAPSATSTTTSSSARQPGAPDETSTQQILSRNLGTAKSTPAGPEASDAPPSPEKKSKFVTGGTFEESRLNESVQVGDYKYRIV